MPSPPAGSAAADEAGLLARLLAEPDAGVAAAVRWLAANRLWQALLPGISRNRLLRHLGAAAPELLATSLALLPDLEAALWQAGLPCPWQQPDPALLAQHMLAADTPPMPPCWSPEAWRSQALRLVDATAAALLGATPLDPLDAMACLDGIDLRGVLGLADLPARRRLAAGLADAGSLAAFARCHLRWSAAAGLLLQADARQPSPAAVSAAYLAVPHGPESAAETRLDANGTRSSPGIALPVTPEAAQQMVPGWPPGAWLLVIEADVARWDVALVGDVAHVLAGLPAWPPFPGLAVAELAAEREVELLRRVAAEPGIAQAASDRISLMGQASRDVAAEDLDW